jgi:hypothetical protein
MSTSDLRTRSVILDTIQDLVADFLYYDRQEDQYLPVGAIEQALGTGVITLDEVRVSEPVPPHNVRAVMADGREIPVGCEYSGCENDTYRWTAVWALPERPRSFLVAMLPAKTAIAFRWEEV